MTSSSRGGRLLGAHHDGSALYVPRRTPELGETVPVRLRVPADGEVRAVHLRTVRDGEPRLSPARLVAEEGGERWYEADVLVHNPVTGYRFLLDLPGDYRWLNGRGSFAREVTDAADFRLTVHRPAPAWMADTVVYQIFPDRFARSGEPRDVPEWAVPVTDWNQEPIGEGRAVGRQLYGGDLPGIESRLDHLVRLGVGTVYLTPVFPGRSNHRYDASTFEHVDPLLGGDEALVSLRRAAHARGLRLMGDITTNHTGAGHDWFERGRTPGAPESELFYWTEEAPGHVGWKEHPSLPKLNYASELARERMFGGPDSVIGRWLAEPFRLDGWRIDVANMTGRYRDQDQTHEVARAIRATMAAVHPEAALVAEHFHDSAADLMGDGWHANMNYSAFTRPVWSWIAPPEGLPNLLDMPTRWPRRPGGSMVETMRDFDSAMPWKVTERHWNMLGSHDTARLRTVAGSREMVEVAAGLLFTYPGTPALFAGDEVGLTGHNGEHGRATMPWDDPSRWDQATFETYRALIALHRDSHALRHGGLRWAVVEDDAVAFLRESEREAVLVLVARAPWPGATLPRRLLGDGADLAPLYGSERIGVSEAGLTLPGDGPGVHVWRLRDGRG